MKKQQSHNANATPGPSNNQQFNQPGTPLPSSSNITSPSSPLNNQMSDNTEPSIFEPKENVVTNSIPDTSSTNDSALVPPKLNEEEEENQTDDDNTETLLDEPHFIFLEYGVPLEIQIQIFNRLSPLQRFNLMMSHRSFYHTLQDDDLYWKAIYVKLQKHATDFMQKWQIRFEHPLTKQPIGSYKEALKELVSSRERLQKEVNYLKVYNLDERCFSLLSLLPRTIPKGIKNLIECDILIEAINRKMIEPEMKAAAATADDIGSNILNISYFPITRLPKSLLDEGKYQVFWQTLDSLHLNSTRIENLPENLSICQNLKILKMQDCRLNDVPPCIEKLLQLSILDLSANNLRVIPEFIACLPNLKSLKISFNHLEEKDIPLSLRGKFDSTWLEEELYSQTHCQHLAHVECNDTLLILSFLEQHEKNIFEQLPNSAENIFVEVVLPDEDEFTICAQTNPVIFSGQKRKPKASASMPENNETLPDYKRPRRDDDEEDNQKDNARQRNTCLPS